MEKTYIRPTLNVIEFKSYHQITASSSDAPDQLLGNPKAFGNSSIDEVEPTVRRGSWGNLWEE